MAANPPAMLAAPASASAPASATPLLRSTPSSRSPSFARLPQQRINTTDAVIGAVSSALLNGSSSNSSPVSGSPRQTERSTTNTSIQPSPDGLRGHEDPNAQSIHPLRLPDASLSGSPPRSAMTEAVALSKGPGLIRRISRGAANKLTRRRTSTTNADHRDFSSGPMVMRRRSESRGGAPGSGSVSVIASGAEQARSINADGGNGDAECHDAALELDDVLDEAGLEACTAPATPASGSRTPNCGSSVSGTALTAGGIGPIIPSILQRGTMLTKVTKKKRKTLKFVLDSDAAKVYWDPSKPAKRFYIDDIRDIRTGADARNYREECQVSADCESRWFTIFVAEQGRSKARPSKAIHLIAPNDHIFELWTATLEDISQYRMDVMTGLAGQSETAIRELWNREMSRVSAQPVRAAEQLERLDFEGVERLCRGLHLHCSKSDLRLQFAKADKDSAGSLDYAGFKDFLRRLRERPDLKALYSSLAADVENGLDLAEFLGFLRDEQGIDVDGDSSHWQQVFEDYSRKSYHSSAEDPATARIDDDVGMPRHMRYGAFATFLMSPANAAISLASATPNLDRPLNEYFISSSHNTYLLGRQVAGESSTEPYISALQRGCRCVEVDCWDGPDGRPLVNHGRTLTSSILFADCIEVINKFAFSASPYPLIVSLEVHCCPEQQRVMADILRTIFGDRLLCEPLSTHTSEIPSPEDLKYRVLIKVKAGKDVDEVAMFTDPTAGQRNRSISTSSSRPATSDRPSSTATNSPVCSSPVPGTPRRTPSVWDNASSKRLLMSGASGWPGSATEDSDSKDGPSLTERKAKKKKPSKITKPLGDLGVYTRGLKFAGFGLPESNSYNHVFSFSERTFENLCKDAELKAQLERHNQHHLMRVYPAGYRINSSNFDPNKFWRRGVQMVALNWQTHDLGMQMNDAMFAAGTDRTGYVLKPPELRKPAGLAPEDALGIGLCEPQAKKERKLVKFAVEVISAQQLPRPRGTSAEQSIDPYVEFEVFCADDKAKGVAVGQGGHDASARNGMSGIGSPHRRRTRIVPKNGYNPIFRDQFIVTMETKFPGLVFLRWTVYNSADGRSYGDRSGLLASFTAKLDSLQEGYRHLPLYDNKGEQFLFATLFCRLQKEEVVTLSSVDVRSAKAEGFKNFGRSMFSRTMSTERKASADEC